MQPKTDPHALHVKMSIFGLFGISGMFGLMGLGGAIMGLASPTHELAAITGPLICISLVAMNAASGLVWLNRRVSELEKRLSELVRQSAENNQAPRRNT
jgi:hypothetical protein